MSDESDRGRHADDGDDSPGADSDVNADSPTTDAGSGVDRADADEEVDGENADPDETPDADAPDEPGSGEPDPDEDTDDVGDHDGSDDRPADGTDEADDPDDESKSEKGPSDRRDGARRRRSTGLTGDAGGLRTVEETNGASSGSTDSGDGIESDSGDDQNSGGLTRVDDGDDQSSGGLARVDDGDDQSSGGLRTVDGDDDGPDGPPPEDPDEPGRVGHYAGPGPETHRSDLSGPDPDDGPPPGHAVGAPTPGEAPATDGEAAEASPESETEADPAASGDAASTGSSGSVDLSEPGLGADASTVDRSGPEAGPTTADAGTSGGASGLASPATSPEDLEQPPDDEEMPLAEHVQEMVTRLGIVAVCVAVATAVAFPFATDVLNAMWYGVLPAESSAPHVYGPLEKLLTEIKVASLAGVLVAFPVLVYQSYRFMRPGLYPRERRYYLAAVPTSLVLATVGMVFAYFLVLPVLFDYFVVYSKSGVDELKFSLRVTFDLIVALLGSFALVFQIPLLIMLAIMMGVTTRDWLEARRLYFWGGFLGVSFLIGGADLTGMAPLIIAATMIGLFEGTLTLLRWTDSG